MDAKGTIDHIITLDGVYGAFFSSHRDQSIIAKVPHDYPAAVLQGIAYHGEDVLEQVRKGMKDCHEVRLDMQNMSILMFLVTGGIVYAMVYKQAIIEQVRNAVYGICQEAEKAHQQNMLLTSRITPADLPKEITEPSSEDSPLAMEPIKAVQPKSIKESRYTDEVLIGEGGSAQVFRAYDTRIKRQVALKRFKENFNTNLDEVAYSELESASRIQHHNVVSTHDVDMDDHGRFLVMELIQGDDLETVLEKGPLDLNRFIGLAIQSLEALTATHEAGLLHLDIKPANLMFSENSNDRVHVKLIDYGQAALMEDQPKGAGLSGSIHYASPEYLSEKAVDLRSDLYSLGCVFYTALSGIRPFEGDSILVIMAAHLRHRVTDIAEVVPGLPAWLAEWVMSLMSQNPEDRPASAEVALESLLQRGMTKFEIEQKKERELAQA